MCFRQNEAISTFNANPQKLVGQFTYLGSNISSTKSDVNIRMGKAWIAIDKLSTKLKVDVSNKIKHEIKLHKNENLKWYK